MRRATVRPSADAGFSLIEVLVAVAILGFIALGIAGLFSQSVLTNASGYDYAQLASEGRRALETLKSLPYNDAALNPTGGTPVDLTTRLAGYQLPRLFEIELSVDEFDVDAGDDLADMTGWTVAATANTGNIKRVTVRVESTKGLIGRRQFVSTALLVRG
jgi:prepilin-type N-terminal cleavage/methylation domain-containing protein